MIFALGVVFAALASSQQPSAQSKPDQAAPKSNKVDVGPFPELRLQPAVATPWFRVKELRSGWVANRTLVFLDEPGPTVGTNPEGCLVTNYGYVVNETHGGANLFHTYLLTAFMNHREVSLVILGCYGDGLPPRGVPQVVGVAIR
jgi:hypothetical protein